MLMLGNIGEYVPDSPNSNFDELCTNLRTRQVFLNFDYLSIRNPNKHRL